MTDRETSGAEGARNKMTPSQDPPPWHTVSDHDLTQKARGAGGTMWTEIEMMRRLKDTLVAQHQANTVLTEKIRQLNWWLLWYTIAIAMLTAFQMGWMIWGR